MCIYFEKQAFFFDEKKVCRILQINNLKISFTNHGHSNINSTGFKYIKYYDTIKNNCKGNFDFNVLLMFT